MSSYPTPPLTSSPKNTFAAQSHNTYNPSLQQYSTQDNSPQTYQQPYQAPYDASTRPIQAQDPSQPYTYQPPYSQTTAPAGHAHSQSFSGPKLPAQESYFHSYSAPSSPSHGPNALPHTKPETYASGVGAPQQPPRRRSSPTPYRPASPLITPPRPQRSPGNPNYYSNSPLPILSPRPVGGFSSPLTPYNLNRPKKRPGFLKRIFLKLQQWMRALGRWTKRNPIKMGILTFLPVMTLAAIAKIVRGVGKGLGFIEQGHKREKLQRGGSARDVRGEGNVNVRSVQEGKAGDQDGVFGMFKGFGNSKKSGGVGEGWLKVLQMLV